MKIRCSQIGKIMTNSRSKDSLSKTCKSYIQEIVLEEKYGIKKEFWSRYTDKGNLVEQESISLADEVLNWQLPFVAEGYQQYFENDYICGHTDVNTENILADVKSSWSADTFPFFETTIEKNYMWQLMGYMWLTGHKKANLTYCLINTPEEMVLDEIRREHWKQNSFWNGDEDDEIVSYIRSKHNFDHIPKEKRVKNYIIEYDENLIKDLKDRIEQCRIYYNQIKSII
jgi:hypothetical protein